MSQKKKPTGRTPRVVLYFRNSSVMQEKSILRQHGEVNPYVVLKGYIVVEVVEDADISGSEVLRRPGLQRVIALALSGKIDGIAVDDWDRLMRLDMLEMGELLSPLRRAGVWIESVAQGRFDYETMTGRLMMGITSEGKKEQTLDTARRSLTEQARMARDLGDPPLPKPAYGYRRVEDMDRPVNRNGKRPGKIIIEPREAEVVKQVFQWYAKGHTPGQICAELRRRSVPTATGRLYWNRATIRGMLDNPAYCGDRGWGKSAQGKFWRQEAGLVVPTRGARKSVLRPPEEWLMAEDKNPVIIDRDLWQTVKIRRDRSRAKDVLDDDGNVIRQEGEASSPRAEPGAFLLSRMLVCGKCGSWMTGFLRPLGKRVNAYTCAKYMAHGSEGCVRCEVREEEAVARLVKELRQVLAPERQQWLRDQLRERLQSNQASDIIAARRKRVQALTGQLDRYRKRLLDVSQDMVHEVEDAIRIVRGELQEAEEDLAQAESADPVKDLETVLDASSKAIWKLEQALQDGDRIALREALYGVVEKVVVHAESYQTSTGKERRKPGSIEVHLRKGTGLDMLCRLGDVPTGTSPGLTYHLQASA